MPSISPTFSGFCTWAWGDWYCVAYRTGIVFDTTAGLTFAGGVFVTLNVASGPSPLCNRDEQKHVVIMVLCLRIF